MPNRRLLIIFITFVMIASGFGVGIYTARYYGGGASAPAVEGMLWPQPKQLMPFATVDHSGAIFGLDRLRDKWSFLFFGYTHCPDICPATLSVLNQAYAQLQDSGLRQNVQMIFVTVDPERDNSLQLAGYVSYFNPAFIGLGGSNEQVQSLARQIGVVYWHGEASETGDYLVDHSASVFLISPDARVISIFSAPLQAETIVSRFKQISAFLKDNG